MKTVIVYSLILNGLLALPGAAATNVPLTIQEALYPGSVSGVTRAAGPVTFGIPLPDDPSTGVTDVNQLTLTGAQVGQFRVLGRWPSGRIKWVLVDTQANVTAGQTNTSIALATGGNGNFGGSNLATDNGATITVATGAATFTIRKDHFNVVDQAIVAGKTIVSTGTSQGLVVTGPAPGQTTCPPCTTVYSSANDASSTAVIEENGPAKTVIKATGSHVDSLGNAYMHFTVRMYFYKGSTAAKLTVSLRNADYGTSNTFATAFKGHQGYELRITPNISGTMNYSVAADSTQCTAGVCSGTMTNSDTVYLYQGHSQTMQYYNWCGYGCLTFSNDEGYTINKNGATVASGDNTKAVGGWADISDASGAGVEIGVYQLSAYWPKSLEFNNGTDVRIGIWARENSQPYYQTWPHYSTHDLYLNFHASAPASTANEFLKFQHYLLARASVSYYNSTAVFPYSLVDAPTLDSWMTSVGAGANPATISTSKSCCLADETPVSYRYYYWPDGGGGNQTEFRWSNLLSFLSRGEGGRFVHASQFYRFVSDSAFARADGFNWRDKTGELDNYGFPSAASANSSLAMRDMNQLNNSSATEHGHWYGLPDYYFLTGDEYVKDALLDGPKNWFLNNNTYQANGSLWNARAVGVELMGSARFSNFLTTIGDPDAATALSQGISAYTAQVSPQLCASGYPAGCSIGVVDGGPWVTQGVNRVRGVFATGLASTGSVFCGVAHSFRVNKAFMDAILVQGILELRNTAGPSWSEYTNAMDLAYGLGRSTLAEMFVDDGSGRWDINGFRYELALDWANNCSGPGETHDGNTDVTALETDSSAFLPLYLVDGSTAWATKYNIFVQKNMSSLGMGTSDFSSYQIPHMLNIIHNPTANVLNPVAIAGFTPNGGGSYTISWTVPTGAQSYRIKWGPKQIVDWVGFDPMANTFTGDPVNTMPWFAGTNVTAPAPAAAGSTQSLTVNTGVAGLTVQSFSVKAYMAGSAPPPSLPPPPTVQNSLVLVSGNGQSGTAGQKLGAPLVVKVQDSNGNPVAGVGVTFAVTAGGGSLSSTQVTTDTTGSASSLLTLGNTAGANTVTAASGSLTGSPLTFTATAIASSQPGAWSYQEGTWATSQLRTPGVPAFDQWLKILYDPVSQQIYHYGILPTSSSIYSTDVYFYNTGGNAWTHVGGTGSLGDTCAPSTPTWPSDRHPMGQTALDTKRSLLWMWGGVCQGNNPNDMWYLQLNANPLADTWHPATPPHLPPYIIASATYDPDDDVIISFGNDGQSAGHYTWVYCSTLGSTTPGVLSAKQVAAGCKQPDDWSESQVAGGVMPTAGTNLPGVVYDTVNKKVILFGGYAPGPGAPASETWAYDVPTKTWVNRSPSSGPTFAGAPVSDVVGTPLTYNPNDGKVYFQNPSTTPTTWNYDYAANKWTLICSACGGPLNPITMAYDLNNNALVALGYGGPGQLEVWKFGLSGFTGPAPKTCDLNGDGVINFLDVQIAINQALGTAACGSADLLGTGVCSIVDVQRITNAANGGACLIGP